MTLVLIYIALHMESGSVSTSGSATRTLGWIPPTLIDLVSVAWKVADPFPLDYRAFILLLISLF